MKQALHPTYYHDAQVTCTCGNTFTTGSTKKDIKVEICYNCHPFFTGEMKFIDTMGRVEKFQKKQAFAKQLKYVKKDKKHQDTEDETPQSLREMMLKEKQKLDKTSEKNNPQKN